MRISQLLRSAIIVLLLVALTACEDEHPDINTLHISAGTMVADSARASAIVSMPGLELSFDSTALQNRVRIPIYVRRGAIAVKFFRVKGAADTIGRGEISFDIKAGNLYEAYFVRWRANTLNICMGCTGSRFSIMQGSASASKDSMVIQYFAGRPLCKGCVTQRPQRSGTVVARRD